jgi:putative transposase
MPIDYYPPFEPGQLYHVYNQGNSGNKIFFTKANYEYFLRKYILYLETFIDTYAYCLLPNHFHFVVRVKDDIDLMNSFDKCKMGTTYIRKITEAKPDEQTSVLVSEVFRRFFMSYSKSINVQENRRGSLFSKNVKRKFIDNDDYARRVIYYIHHNPQHHRLTDDFRNYPLSSYHEIITNKSGKLKVNEAIALFQDLDNFIFYHNQDMDVGRDYKMES